MEQPEQTAQIVEWIKLGLDDSAALDGVEIAVGETPPRKPVLLPETRPDAGAQ